MPPGAPPLPPLLPGWYSGSSVAELRTGIASAPDGATLLLTPGTYALSATLVIDRHLTLVGAESGEVVLDAGGSCRVRGPPPPAAVGTPRAAPWARPCRMRAWPPA